MVRVCVGFCVGFRWHLNVPSMGPLPECLSLGVSLGGALQKVGHSAGVTAAFWSAKPQVGWKDSVPGPWALLDSSVTVTRVPRIPQGMELASVHMGQASPGGPGGDLSGSSQCWWWPQGLEGKHLAEGVQAVDPGRLSSSFAPHYPGPVPYLP